MLVIRKFTLFFISEGVNSNFIRPIKKLLLLFYHYWMKLKVKVLDPEEKLLES